VIHQEILASDAADFLTHLGWTGKTPLAFVKTSEQYSLHRVDALNRNRSWPPF